MILRINYRTQEAVAVFDKCPGVKNQSVSEKEKVNIFQSTYTSITSTLSSTQVSDVEEGTEVL